MSNRKMIVKGVGTMMAKRICPDGRPELITCGTLQDLRIDMSVEIDEIFGGDGMFAIDTLVTNKSIELAATDASFDLNAVSLMMGSQLESGATTIWALNELTEVDENGDITTEYEIAAGTNGDISVRLADTNLVLPGPFSGAGSNEISVPAGYAGKQVYVSYKREVQDATWSDIMADQVPFPIHVIHHGSFQQKDGTFQGIETELYACQAKGTFSIDVQRSAASTSAIELQVIQPEHSRKLGTIKRFTDTGAAQECKVLTDDPEE